MRYRFKDQDVRQAFKLLGWPVEFDDAEMDWVYSGDGKDIVIVDRYEEFEVEPVEIPAAEEGSCGPDATTGRIK